MAEYLGEVDVTNSDENPYKDYTREQMAMLYIQRYGQIDGGHHKQWVLDQVARILKGSTVTVRLARWSDGQYEHRIDIPEPSKEYREWVEWMCDGEDGPDTYGYEEGIAP